MKINNKEFREWTADDLQVLLNNDAYRENNFIDYKVNFAPLLDKNNKKEKQAEFRNDVCSFANADGGYIFFGIGESSGAASILAGISIPNIDRFELDRRNELQAIRPTVPEVAFSFIPLQDDKYVVVLHIQRGLYKPYITEEPEGQFHFYIRHGNKKQAMSYTEIRNGFLNAAMLSEDIKSFRKERLEEHITEMKKPFALVQVIPATFRNIENASIVPCTQLLENPSPLLEDIRFRELLDKLATEYRFVIIDTPPLGSVSDGALIASMCDGALLVIRAGSVPKTIIRQSLHEIDQAGCKLLGTVLNCVEGAGGRYGKYGHYGKYGKYGHYGQYGYGPQAEEENKKSRK